MKKFTVLLLSSLAIFLLLGSCASLKLENYRSAGENVIYRTDFNQLDDRFMIAEEGKTVQIDDGALHLEGVPGGPAAHVEFSEPFGNNSVTSLKLKLSESRPTAFINFLAGDQGRLAGAVGV